MRVVAQFQTAGEAEVAAKILEGSGIPAVVHGSAEEWATSITGAARGAEPFVVFDRQYVDATRLLDDPEHVVKTKLTERELRSRFLHSQQPHPTLVILLA